MYVYIIHLHFIKRKNIDTNIHYVDIHLHSTYIDNLCPIPLGSST